MQRELCIVGRLDNLPDIASFVDECADQTGVGEGARFDLQLAVEEACTNVIVHAYGGQAGEFELCFEAHGRDVWITIRDHGRPFDPSRVPRPDLTLPLEERQIGGLGLHLMESLMDEVRFSFTEGQNTLVMVKRKAIRAGQPDAE